MRDSIEGGGHESHMVYVKDFNVRVSLTRTSVGEKETSPGLSSLR